VHAGTPASLEQNPTRSRAPISRAHVDPGAAKRRTATGSIKIAGAKENNLRDIDVEFPLGVLTAVTGVSGAGKSTLVNDILYPALARALHQSTRRVGRTARCTGSTRSTR
jgi:excinuclease ABC subunit A